MEGDVDRDVKVEVEVFAYDLGNDVGIRLFGPVWFKAEGALYPFETVLIRHSHA